MGWSLPKWSDVLFPILGLGSGAIFTALHFLLYLPMNAINFTKLERFSMDKHYGFMGPLIS